MTFKVAHNTIEIVSHINKKSPDYNIYIYIYRMIDKNGLCTVIQIGPPPKKKCSFGQKIIFSKIQFGKCEHCKARGGFKLKICRLISQKL